MTPTETAINVSLKNVLVATDFSLCSFEATRCALGIARRYDSTVHLVHVVPSFGPLPAAQSPEAAMQEISRFAESLLEDGSLSGIAHDVLVTTGDVWSALSQIIEQKAIDLLVMGTHGRSGLARFVLGSMTETAIHHASCPVLTIGPGLSQFRSSGPPPKIILFPTDLSEQTESAAPYAVLFAQKYAAKLIFLHATQQGAAASPAVLDRIKSQLRELAKSEGDDLICCPDPVVRKGSPAETILQVAHEYKADLIVFGISVSCREGNHFGLPVAYSVISRADCPVLTIRALHTW